MQTICTGWYVLALRWIQQSKDKRFTEILKFENLN